MKRAYGISELLPHAQLQTLFHIPSRCRRTRPDREANPGMPRRSVRAKAGFHFEKGNGFASDGSSRKAEPSAPYSRMRRWRQRCGWGHITRRRCPEMEARWFITRPAYHHPDRGEVAPAPTRPCFAKASQGRPGRPSPCACLCPGSCLQLTKGVRDTPYHDPTRHTGD